MAPREIGGFLSRMRARCVHVRPPVRVCAAVRCGAVRLKRDSLRDCNSGDTKLVYQAEGPLVYNSSKARARAGRDVALGVATLLRHAIKIK